MTFWDYLSKNYIFFVVIGILLFFVFILFLKNVKHWKIKFGKLSAEGNYSINLMKIKNQKDYDDLKNKILYAQERIAMKKGKIMFNEIKERFRNWCIKKKYKYDNVKVFSSLLELIYFKIGDDFIKDVLRKNGFLKMSESEFEEYIQQNSEICRGIMTDVLDSGWGENDFNREQLSNYLRENEMEFLYLSSKELFRDCRRVGLVYKDQLLQFEDKLGE